MSSHSVAKVSSLEGALSHPRLKNHLTIVRKDSVSQAPPSHKGPCRGQFQPKASTPQDSPDTAALTGLVSQAL